MPAAEAAKEFERHGLTEWVTVRQRNIEEQGFPCGATPQPSAGADGPEPGAEAAAGADGAAGASPAGGSTAGGSTSKSEEVDLTGQAHAVFLDLPGPHKAGASSASTAVHYSSTAAQQQ